MGRLIAICLLFGSVSSLAAQKPFDPFDFVRVSGSSKMETCSKWLLRESEMAPSSPVTIDVMVIQAESNPRYLQTEWGEALLLADVEDPINHGRAIYYLPVSLDELKKSPSRIVTVDESKIRVAKIPAFIYGGFIGNTHYIGKVEVTIDLASEHEGDFYTLSFSHVTVF